MPPEAFGGNVSYDPSLDTFSFGHLSLFTITQAHVRPLLPPNYTDTTTGELHARSEVKRREEFIRSAEKLLPEDHSLVAVTKQCLNNNPAQRPRTGELVKILSEIKSSGELSLQTSTFASNETYTVMQVVKTVNHPLQQILYIPTKSQAYMRTRLTIRLWSQ